jgi:hypothetical protein
MRARWFMSQPRTCPPRPAPRIGGDPQPVDSTSGQNVGGLPVGRYECSYRSPYAGEIPNGRSILILDEGRYQAWGSSGGYIAGRPGGIQWNSGPFAARGVSATFAVEGNRAVLTVKGGAAADDPGGTNRCVRSGG